MTKQNTQEQPLDGYSGLVSEVARTGRRLTRDEVDSRRAVGEAAAAAGQSLRSAIRDHVVGMRAAWPRTEAWDSADRALAAVEQVIDALAEGYERAQRLAVREEESFRREFIDDLLHGRSSLGRLAERAERFGLRLARGHAVAVAQGSRAYSEADPVARRVDEAMHGRFGERSILLTTKEGRLICIAPGDDKDVLVHFAKQAHAATDGGQVAIGRQHAGAGGVVQSYEEALSTLDLAARMGLDAPVLHSADQLVYPVLTRDRQAMADLVTSTLGPLREARGGAGPLLDTLTAYFDAGCVAAQAARSLSLSVRALTYRLERIHHLTGTNPTDPLHRYTLQTAVIGARLLDWPRSEL
ncbi:PucR family transcriptional regulator [Streptomyces luteolus]|uniref:Helix-turn-helix domain-containing protein n=1 Tax=Streptomyces luteolus TaxID=3043615 RepID=A0ABT6SSX2_9ACTN|nr:helix-turn-helix domain-containing protein [Streptomyces sp. B-S-A12]MDI3418717.1 helix-turn-helix domain-containing protein [Streptomyces sp. B-S-A12]